MMNIKSGGGEEEREGVLSLVCKIKINFQLNKKILKRAINSKFSLCLVVVVGGRVEWEGL